MKLQDVKKKNLFQARNKVCVSVSVLLFCILKKKYSTETTHQIVFVDVCMFRNQHGIAPGDSCQLLVNIELGQAVLTVVMFESDHPERHPTAMY